MHLLYAGGPRILFICSILFNLPNDPKKLVLLSSYGIDEETEARKITSFVQGHKANEQQSCTEG